MNAQSKGKPAAPLPTRTAPLEWLVAAAGGLLLAGSLAFMIVAGLTRPSGPPDFEASAAPARVMAGGYLVEVTLQNTGRRTAAQVTVSARLVSEGQTVESSRAILDYLPETARRTVGFFFTRNPEDYSLQVQVEGYSEP